MSGPLSTPNSVVYEADSPTRNKRKRRLLEAERMRTKWASPMSWLIYSKKAEINHRTMVKVDKGLRPGEVTKITVFPYGFSTFLDSEVAKITLSVLNRRSHLWCLQE